MQSQKLKQVVDFAPTDLATALTLPTAAELAADPVNLDLSDFALFTGAQPLRMQTAVDGTISYAGQVWTRSVGRQGKALVCSGDCADIAVSVLPDLSSIAVAPRLVNPSREGYDLSAEGYLTKNGQLVYYPQQQVPAPLATQFTHALGGNGVIKAADFSRWQQLVFTQRGQSGLNWGCYRFQGADYACFRRTAAGAKRATYDWFKLQPLAAQRCRDGSIQCPPLFASPLDNCPQRPIAGDSLYKKQVKPYHGHLINVADTALARALNTLALDLTASTQLCAQQTLERSF